MDPDARRAHLQALLSMEEGILAQLDKHVQKISSHHASKERDRALRQAKASIRRHDRMRRRWERALRVQR